MTQEWAHSPPTNVALIEFVVGSRCSPRFFSRYSGFPKSSKTNIFKFQFGLESVHTHENHGIMCQTN